VLVHCEATSDRERRRSSAQGDLRGPRRQDKTRTVDLVTLQTAIMDRPRRDSRQHNGITLQGLSQLTSATKSATSRHQAMA
jgi:hypothetical protein